MHRLSSVFMRFQTAKRQGYHSCANSGDDLDPLPRSAEEASRRGVTATHLLMGGGYARVGLRVSTKHSLSFLREQ